MFYQIATAAFVGVLMAASFLWAMWTAVRLERQGYKHSELPWRVYIAALVPAAIAVLSALGLS